MANAARKHHKNRTSRRRLAAISFLSNISLDGTHNDTKLAVYARKQKRHLRKEDGDKEADSDKQRGMEVTRIFSGDKPDRKSKQVVPSEEIKSAVAAVPCVVNKSEKGVEALLNSTSSFSTRWRESQMNEQTTVNDMSQRAKKTTIVVDINVDSEAVEQWLTELLTASLSGDGEKQAVKKKLVHMLSDLGSRREYAEPTGERSRRSSSMSDNSSESAPKEVRFLSPDSHRAVSTGRVFFVSKERSPLAVCSILPFSKKQLYRQEVTQEEVRPRVRHTSGSRSVSSSEGLFHTGLAVSARVEEGQDVSYSRFLIPSRNRLLLRANSDSVASAVEGGMHVNGHEVLRSMSADACPTGLRMGHALDKVPEDVMEHYDAHILDDPELHSGSYRTLMTFPSYIVSVTDYVKPSVLKKELNDKFRDRFPSIQLTLSKLRSLKRELKKIAYTKCHRDIWTVAQAYVYFEKLILKNLLNKQNRKLCAGACLLLACKLNDTKGLQLTKLLETLEDIFKLNRKDLLNFELECLVALEFCLHVPDREVFPHYQRLLYNA